MVVTEQPQPQEVEAVKWQVSRADIHHERHMRLLSDMIGSVFQAGQGAIKAPAIVNGGALAAALSLVASRINSDQPPVGDYRLLVSALCAFIAGVLLGALAAPATYVSQYFYTKSFERREFTWNHPYVSLTRKSESAERIGVVFHASAVLVVLASFLVFAMGAVFMVKYADSALTAKAEQRVSTLAVERFASSRLSPSKRAPSRP